jgi:hypothetical protein
VAVIVVSTRRNASSSDVHGEFNPEATVATFNDAIEAALKDGFNGFRAVANMSWALGVRNG